MQKNIIKKTYQLVLVRHGQSEWNLQNKFTGWKDVELTQQGIEEAKFAGQLLRDENFKFNKVYSSYLRRALDTWHYLSKELDQQHLPLLKSWRLNERHYGGLTGLNKKETAQKYGDEQVKQWRRSYATPPPELELTDERHPVNDPKYELVPKRLLPNSESLKMTLERVLPYFYDNIVKDVLNDQQVLVVAHGNSIRAIVKELEQMSEEEIIGVNIPTGVPLLYEFNRDLQVSQKRYLGDEEQLKKRIEEVANQSKKQLRLNKNYKSQMVKRSHHQEKGDQRGRKFFVFGRALPTEENPNPEVIAMRVFAKNVAFAQSKFWKLNRMQNKIKKSRGEVLRIQEVFDSGKVRARNFAIYLKYRSRTSMHNLVKEYRATTEADAISQMYNEMGGNHRCSTSIEIIRCVEINEEQMKVRNPRCRMWMDTENVKFPVWKKTSRKTHPTYESTFQANRPVLIKTGLSVDV